MTKSMPIPLRRERHMDVSGRGPKGGVGEYHTVTLPAEPWCVRDDEGHLVLPEAGAKQGRDEICAAEKHDKTLKSLVGVARFELTTPASRRHVRSAEPHEIRQLVGLKPPKMSLLPAEAGAKRGPKS